MNPSIDRETVAVTGGTGFIGRPLVDRLRKEGKRVRVLTRDPAAARRIWPGQGVKTFEGDLADARSKLEPFVDGVATLFHCAGEIRNRSRMAAVHVDGTRRLVCAAEGRIRRWVQLSSVGAYGPQRRGVVTEDSPCNPKGAYEKTKTESDRIVEKAARKGAFSCILLRPSIVFGPGMKSTSLFQWISMIDRRMFFFIGPPGASASYIPVENVVEALWLCAEADIEGCRTYIVSDRMDLESFVRRIAQRLGRPAPRLRLPEPSLRAVAGLLEHLPGFPLTRSRIDALTRRTVYSCRRIQQELGYRHRVALPQALDAMVEAWKQRRNESSGPVAPEAAVSRERQAGICRVATVPITFATLLYEQIRHLAGKGLHITLAGNPEPLLFQVAEELGVPCRGIPLSRKVDPIRDFRAVFRMAGIFRKGGYRIVHSSTPKAGLITALAGRLARVPVRLHTFTGQVWVEKKGLPRWILKSCDALIGRLDTGCYADSRSQMQFLVREKVVSRSRIRVLGAGSISGVDLRRFDPEALGKKTRIRIRAALKIPESSIVVLFVGRVTRDKGICELVAAYEALQEQLTDAHLLLVGPFEPERDPLPQEIVSRIEAHPSIHATGFQKDVERYMAAADIFCLPSYREGFGSVVIEAGAMTLPTVAAGVVGLVDAVVDGKTGILVPAKDIRSLGAALRRLGADEKLRREMGRTARIRAVRFFDADYVNDLVGKEYRRWLGGGLVPFSKGVGKP